MEFSGYGLFTWNIKGWMMFKWTNLCVLIAVALLMNSCSQNKQPGNAPSVAAGKVVSGTLNVDADPGLEKVMKLQQEVFQYQYDSIKLNIQYKNEFDMLEDFRTGKATVMVMAGVLDSAQKESLMRRDTIYVNDLQVAYDAVALIGNKQFDDANLDLAKLKSYFDPANTNPDVPQMVFNDEKSSVVKFVMSTLGFKEKVSSHVYALKSTEEVIDYVKNSKNALGFIPFNVLSDVGSERVKKLLDSIKIISLRAKDKDGNPITVSANQGDIALGLYPLTRNIYTEMRYGSDDSRERLFVNFLFKERGARIFMTDGLMPMRIPAMNVEVNTDNGLKSNN
jgi:phosphate transport system substrate-binding protein